jgi:hypothetical protein
MVDFRFVHSVEELRENLRRLPALCNENPHFWRKLFRAHTYLLFDEESGAFGPNKWAAYWQLNAESYKHLLPMSPWWFGGEKARQEIERVRGSKYGPQPDLVERLKEWSEGLFGSGALAGTSSSKWEFLVLK